MEQQELKKISDELYQSLRTGVAVSPLTERFPAITIDDAYKVSLNMLAMREADGERLIGKKIGVTSEAVQNMLNVRQPDFGFLTDKMQFSERLSLTGMIAPKAEGEIAFRLKSDLKGPGVSEALPLIHISEPTRPLYISYAVFCLKKKKKKKKRLNILL